MMGLYVFAKLTSYISIFSLHNIHNNCFLKERRKRETVTYMDFGCRGKAITNWLLGETDKHIIMIMNDPGNTL